MRLNDVSSTNSSEGGGSSSLRNTSQYKRLFSLLQYNVHSILEIKERDYHVNIADSWYRISIDALIFDDNGKVLLSQQGDGTWDLPSTGLEHEVDIETCLRNKLENEMKLGVDCIDTGPSCFFIEIDKTSSTRPWKGSLCYGVKLKDAVLVDSVNEDNVGYFDHRSLEGMKVSPNVAKIFDQIEHDVVECGGQVEGSTQSDEKQGEDDVGDNVRTILGDTYDIDIEDAWYRMSIKALIRNSEGRIMVCRKKDGKWDLPGGGIDHGEDVPQCIIREIKEEMGLGVDTIGASPACFSPAYKPHSKTSPWKGMLCYDVTLPKSDFDRANEEGFSPSDECLEVEFCDRETIRELDCYRRVFDVFDAVLG